MKIDKEKGECFCVANTPQDEQQHHCYLHLHNLNHFLLKPFRMHNKLESLKIISSMKDWDQNDHHPAHHNDNA